jgi:hypothetical protein
MSKRHEGSEKAIQTLMAEKTRLLTQAQTLDELGMQEAARPLWREIAGREERIAPLLDMLGREREAAVHRISAASCYERVDDYPLAANLYRAAMAGPLLEKTQQEVREMLERCLTHLASEAAEAMPARTRPRAEGSRHDRILTCDIDWGGSGKGRLIPILLLHWRSMPSSERRSDAGATVSPRSALVSVTSSVESSTPPRRRPPHAAAARWRKVTQARVCARLPMSL